MSMRIGHCHPPRMKIRSHFYLYNFSPSIIFCHIFYIFKIILSFLCDKILLMEQDVVYQNGTKIFISSSSSLNQIKDSFDSSQDSELQILCCRLLAPAGITTPPRDSFEGEALV